MSKFNEAIETCKTQMKDCGITCEDTLLTSIAKSLGPSLYNNDANLVSASDDKEVSRIKSKFLVEKLGVSTEEADKAFTHAVEKIGTSNRRKLRPVFYYLMVKYLNKEKVYS